MFKDKLKKMLNKDNEEEGQEKAKRKIENLVVFAIILIITIISINLIWNGDKKESSEENTTSSKKLASVGSSNNINLEQTPENSSSNELESKLKNILSKIQGVGEVEVFINYSETSEIVPMYNENSQTSTTEETDTSGGTRKIEETDSQKEIIFQEDDGTKNIITQKIIEPKIEGAIITAEGAGDANVKTNIIQAVEATTGLATHKIQVFVMN